MMIYVIKKQYPEISSGFLLSRFNVSRSSFYQWKKKFLEGLSISKERLCSLIKEIFYKSKGTYGSPRIYHELLKSNVIISERTVARDMKALGLSACCKKRHKIQTTDSQHKDPLAPRAFKTENTLPPFL